MSLTEKWFCWRKFNREVTKYQKCDYLDTPEQFLKHESDSQVNQVETIYIPETLTNTSYGFVVSTRALSNPTLMNHTNNYKQTPFSNMNTELPL